MEKGFDPDYNSLKKSDQLIDRSKELEKTIIESPKNISEISQPQNLSFPTEVISLPSKGLVYQENSFLRSGQIELKQMTTKEEEIISSPTLIQKGLAIDKLLQELIVSDINYNDLIIGDKNAIMLAARVIGYGKDYTTKITCPNCFEKSVETFDLLEIKSREIDYSVLNSKNEYSFELPISKAKIKFKILTHQDEKNIEAEIKFRKDSLIKSNQKADVPELRIRLTHTIFEIDGNRDKNSIRNFIDSMYSKDSAAFRKYIKSITPNIDLSYVFECKNCGIESIINIPFNIEFFWPNAGI